MGLVVLLIIVSLVLGIEVEDAWIRLVPPVLKKTAMFFKIKNESLSEDYLIGAETDICKRTEIHKTVIKGNRAVMVKVESVKIAPKSEVVFKPHSYHLMLIGLKRALEEGQRVEVFLIFKKAGKVRVFAVVKKE